MGLGKMLIRVSALLFMALSLLLLVQTSNAQDSAQDFVAAHNMARAQVNAGLPPLVWDDTVAAFARRFIQTHAGDCRMVHSDGPYGENLAWSSGDLSGTAAVRMWVNERVDYDYGSNTCRAGKVCGHYTQVVWRSSARLGCAKVRCTNGGTLIGCNYDPPGNWVGQRPY